MAPIAHIGMVNFINTAPLYEVWKETVFNPLWTVTEAAPAELNRRLNAGELDLGFISSHEYALHAERYKILDQLSISASGPVGSVFLFSRIAPQKLSGSNILLSCQSQTSVSLVKIILEEFLGVQPNYMNGDVDRLENMEQTFEAVMAIGDEALRLAEGGRFRFRLDLAEAWQERTGLPFVFAVWAVREEFFKKESECVHEIHQQLLRCVARGREEIDAVSRKVAPRIPMSVEACRKYLLGIEYDLNDSKKKGLEHFFSYLIRRGEVNSSALPLKIIN